MHFGDVSERGVPLLQNLFSLLRADTGEKRRHIHDRALVQRRHELAPDSGPRQQRRDENHSRRKYRLPAMLKDELDDGTIGPDEKAVDGVGRLGLHALANEESHHHRHERNREQRCRRHRERLRPRQRLEEPAFLGLKREHRNERDSDDEQGDEQRRPDFLRRFYDERPVRPRISLVLVAFHVLVQVLNHHDRRVNHRADCDRDPTERHDICVQPEQSHRQDRHQNTDRQRQDGNQRA